MAAPSRTNADPVSYDIKVAGKTIDASYQVVKIEIDKKVNQIPKANIIIADGNTSVDGFPASDGSTFVPGNEIEIQLGYGSQDISVFKGVITGQRLKASPSAPTMLEVSCIDKAWQMTTGNKNACFEQMTDSDIISKVIGNYSLEKDIASTTYKHAQMVQYYATDWEFILSRAKANGQLVIVNNNKVATQKLGKDTSSVLALTYGEDILDMDLDLNAQGLFNDVTANSWDAKNQQLVSAEHTSSVAGAGNISLASLADAVNAPNQLLQTSADIAVDELKAWAGACSEQSAYSKVTGSVSCRGSELVEAGCFVTLNNVGNRFEGNVFVSAVKHTVSEGNWISSIEVGLPREAEPGNSFNAASGLLPAISGLSVAVVKQVYQDPDNTYRVLINLPILESDNNVWARISNLYATSGSGSLFYPEVGDEVLVGFLNNDPRDPVILGSMYSDAHKPPYTPDGKNTQKGIITKGKLKLWFDDEKKATEVSTPAGNKITLSDEDRSVTIQDQNGNKIAMSSEGISISSEKNITLSATEGLTLKGSMGATLQADAGDINLKGMNIKANADITASVNGAMTTDIKGGTEVNIKGAMVMIN